MSCGTVVGHSDEVSSELGSHLKGWISSCRDGDGGELGSLLNKVSSKLGLELMGGDGGSFSCTLVRKVDEVGR